MIALALLFMFIAVPVAEITVLIEVGGIIGTPATIGLIIATAIAGTALIRHQGIGVLNDIRGGLDSGAPTFNPLVDALCLLIAGILLLTPGFLTDALGFLLLVPPLRRVIGAALWQAIVKRGNVTVMRPRGRGPQGHRPRHTADIEIEGEFTDLGVKPGGTDANGESPWSSRDKS